MKHCRPGWKRWAAFVFMLLLLIPMILFAVYQLVWGTMLASSERISALFGLPVFVWVLVYLTLRILYFGPMGIDYDDEKIVFHFSKKKEKIYLWEQLKKENVSPYLMRMGYLFHFSDKKQYVINSTMVGYAELTAMLTQKDILPDNDNYFFAKPDKLLIQKIFENLLKNTKK